MRMVDYATSNSNYDIKRYLLDLAQVFMLNALPDTTIPKLLGLAPLLRVYWRVQPQQLGFWTARALSKDTSTYGREVVKPQTADRTSIHKCAVAS